MWRHLYAIGKDFSFITWMFWHKMFRNINHMTLAWWQILLHLHHSLLNCALDFVNFYLFDIPFEFTGENVNLKLIQFIMKFGFAILLCNSWTEFQNRKWISNCPLWKEFPSFFTQNSFWETKDMMICFNTSVYLCSRWSAIVFIISGSLMG